MAYFHCTGRTVSLGHVYPKPPSKPKRIGEPKFGREPERGIN